MPTLSLPRLALPDRRLAARPRDARRARSITSWSVGILNLPSNSVGRPARVCFAPRVLISASVKSEANQPTVGWPSTTLDGPASGELGMLGDVRGVRDVRLVARDQHAVLGRHQVRLDVVRAQLDRQPVRLECVLGQVAARAPVADHERTRLLGFGGGCRESDQGDGGEKRAGEGAGRHRPKVSKPGAERPTPSTRRQPRDSPISSPSDRLCRESRAKFSGASQRASQRRARRPLCRRPVDPRAEGRLATHELEYSRRARYAARTSRPAA